MARDEDCLFCKIVAGDIPSTVVRDGERTFAFRDVNPQAPVHVLVVPKDHHPNAEAIATEDPALAAELLRESAEVAKGEGIAESGYRIVLNTGSGAGQTVWHVHTHVLGGRPMHWPPG